MLQSVYYSRARPQRLRNFLNNVSVARTIWMCAIGIMVLASTACGELEPMVEPEMVDLQLTLDTLKTQVRDGQRNLAEVRAELESRRQELADAQVARAQLEGRVREAERRVTEARHVIELQREELIVARAERERVFRSSSQLQSQMKQMQRKTPRSMNPADSEPGSAIAPTGASFQLSPNAADMTSHSAMPVVNAQATKLSATPATLRQDQSFRYISVKPGDTLWSIARKYRIGLNRLRALNHLSDDQIIVGQTLWVSEE
jgi:LysM repeat protein